MGNTLITRVDCVAFWSEIHLLTNPFPKRVDFSRRLGLAIGLGSDFAGGGRLVKCGTLPEMHGTDL